MLALVDSGGTDELVKIGVLLDATLPVIRNRTRALSVQLAEGKRFEAAAFNARAGLLRSRQELVGKQQQFAELQRRAIEQSLAAGGQALNAGDVAIAAGEQVEELRSGASGSSSARDLALVLASRHPRRRGRLLLQDRNRNSRSATFYP